MYLSRFFYWRSINTHFKMLYLCTAISRDARAVRPYIVQKNKHTLNFSTETDTAYRVPTLSSHLKSNKKTLTHYIPYYPLSVIYTLRDFWSTIP